MSIVASLGPAKKDVEPEFARIRSGRTLQAIKEGWMYKKGGKAFSAFRRRYMILWTNKRIEYYTNDTLNTMKGAVNLMGSQKRAIQRSEKLPKKQQIQLYGFQIATEKRTWYFAVKSQVEREEWIKTIRAVVSVDTSSPLHSPIHSPIIRPITAPIKQKPSPQNLPKPPPKKKVIETKSNTQQQQQEQQQDDEEEEEEEEEDASDYNPEEILENLEREYDMKHNPHRDGKKAKGIQWSDDENNDELTDESDEKDEDIDVTYNWDAAINKIKEKNPGKNKNKKVSMSDDSLNESEDEEEEMEVAKYQKYVYDNEQPMMNIHKKKQQQSSNGRQAIDWDEDEFDSDSLSDETEESDEESVDVIKTKPSTKKENKLYVHKEKETEKPIMNEIKYISGAHVVLRLYYPLSEYIDYKCNEKGKGILIQKVQRNKYGKKLYIKYGFDKDEKWYIESINDENIENKLKKNIDVILKKIGQLNKGYKIVFKKPMKKIKKKAVKKVKKINTKITKKSTKNTKSPKSVKSSKTKSLKNNYAKSPKNNAKSPKNNAKSPKGNNTKSPKNNSAKSPKNGKKSGKQIKKKRTKINK